MMHEITIGRTTHYLTDYAVLALQAAKTAREAEEAFDRYASDVPRRCRCDVWKHVDQIVVPSR